MFSTLFCLKDREPKRADWFFDLVVACQRCGTKRRGLLLQLFGRTEPKQGFQLCHHCVTEVILNTVGGTHGQPASHDQQNGLPGPESVPTAHATGPDKKADRRKTRHLNRHDQANKT